MKKSNWLILLAGLLLVKPYNLAAQSFGLSSSSGEPIQIEAKDGVEWDRLNKTISAMGEAKITKGDMKLESALVTAFYYDKKQPEIFKFKANDDVVFTSKDAVIKGDEAVYNLENNIITVTGNPAKLVRGNDTIIAYDKLEYLQLEKKAIAKGGATIISDGKKLNSDTIEAYFADNKTSDNLELDHVKTLGNVFIKTASEDITANQGYYDAKKSIATLKGNVIIKQQNNTLKGDQAEVNLKTGISRLTSDKDGERVKGRFIKEK